MRKFVYSWIILLCVIVFQSCVREEEDKGEYPEVGDRVPEFVVYSDDQQTGAVFRSADFIGKKSLLLFFDIHCRDCQREMPKIEELWQEIKDDSRCQVVTIAREQKKEETDTFWDTYHLTMPKYLDPDRSVYALFAPNTVPRIYLIDGKGIIQWMALTKLAITIEELTDLLLALEI